MSTFGVGPAARSKNVGIPTSQDSRIVGRGLVKNRSGQIVFDPTVNGIDLVDRVDDSAPGGAVSVAISGTKSNPIFTVTFDPSLVVAAGSFEPVSGGYKQKLVSAAVHMSIGSTVPISESGEPSPENITGFPGHNQIILALEQGTHSVVRYGTEGTENINYLCLMSTEAGELLELSSPEGVQLIEAVVAAGGKLTYQLVQYTVYVDQPASGSPKIVVEDFTATPSETVDYPLQ